MGMVFYKIVVFAKEINKSEKQVRRYIKAGKITGCYQDKFSKTIFIPERELKKFNRKMSILVHTCPVD